MNHELVRQLAEEYGLSHDEVHKRLKTAFTPADLIAPKYNNKKELKALSEQTGISYATLYNRKKRGLEGEELIKPPKHTERAKLLALSKQTGIPYATLYQRKKRGWPDQLLMEPVGRGRPNAIANWQKRIKIKGFGI